MTASITNERKGFIGGSDIAAIIGASPWKTRYALWAEKVHDEFEEIAPDRQAILNWGKRLEGYIVEALIEDHGLDITERNQIYFHPNFPWMRAEIDFRFFSGFDLDNGDCKTASIFGRDGWGESGSDEVPTYYVAQFQWGMSITGAQSCLCAVLFGANDLRLYRIQRDDEIIAHLQKEAFKFWEINVLQRVPPEVVTPSDAQSLINRFNGVTLAATEEMRDTIKRLHGIKQAIKRLEAVESAHSGHIMKSLAEGLFSDGQQTPGNTAIVDAAGVPLLTWNQQSASRISSKKLKELHPEVVAEVTESNTFRVMRIKEKNL